METTNTCKINLKSNSKYNAKSIVVSEGATVYLNDIVSADRIHIKKDATLIAPNLKTITNHCMLDNGASLDAPLLNKLSCLIAGKEAVLNSPKLYRINQLQILPSSNLVLSNIVSINSIHIMEGSTLVAPDLMEGIYINVSSGGKLDCQNLKKSGKITLSKSSHMGAPRLTSAESIKLDDNSALHAPNFSVCREIHSSSKASLEIHTSQLKQNHNKVMLANIYEKCQELGRTALNCISAIMRPKESKLNNQSQSQTKSNSLKR